MKDWAFNRQRYWGEPIPIIYCEHCGMVAVPYDELPLKLPEVENFVPGSDGESPLAKIDSFVNCKCPKCGAPAKRETDTMPQWAGSSWYYLRYCDPHNDKELASKESLEYWMPVDWYNGGMEHVTRHMIYSRFWHKFLYDIGVVNTDEPYMKRTAQGLILGPDGEKMSKSKGNVIDPLDVIKAYGADVLRVYALFMGDYEKAAPWSDSSVKGCKRFLDRVWSLADMLTDDEGYRPHFASKMHKLIKKVSADIDGMKFNTAIAAMMTILNDFYQDGSISRGELKDFLIMLYPFAPHITEEMYQNCGFGGYIHDAKWPEFDESMCKDDEIEIAVQINGKLKDRAVISADAAQDEVLELVKKNQKIAAELDGKTIVKEIYVKGKLVNIVVR